MGFIGSTGITLPSRQREVQARLVLEALGPQSAERRRRRVALQRLRVARVHLSHQRLVPGPLGFKVRVLAFRV